MLSYFRFLILDNIQYLFIVFGNLGFSWSTSKVLLTSNEICHIRNPNTELSLQAVVLLGEPLL